MLQAVEHAGDAQVDLEPAGDHRDGGVIEAGRVAKAALAELGEAGEEEPPRLAVGRQAGDGPEARVGAGVAVLGWVGMAAGLAVVVPLPVQETGEELGQFPRVASVW